MKTDALTFTTALLIAFLTGFVWGDRHARQQILATLPAFREKERK